MSSDWPPSGNLLVHAGLYGPSMAPGPSTQPCCGCFLLRLHCLLGCVAKAKEQGQLRQRGFACFCGLGHTHAWGWQVVHLCGLSRGACLLVGVAQHRPMGPDSESHRFNLCRSALWVCAGTVPFAVCPFGAHAEAALVQATARAKPAWGGICSF